MKLSLVRVVPPALALALAPALAQDPPSPDDQEPELQDPREVPGPEVPTIDLALEDAVRLALGSNLSIRQDAIAAEIASYDALGSWGAFEWVFDASFTYADAEQDNTAISDDFFEDQNVDPPDPEDSETRSLSIDFTKPMTTGGTFESRFFSSTRETTQAAAVIGDTLVALPSTFSSEFLSLTYTQPLRRGAWSEYATSVQREREILYRRQVEAERQGRQTLLLDVENAYWDLVSAVEQREVARSSLDLGIEQLDQNRRREVAGLGTPVEVVQAEAEVATRIEVLLRADNAVEQAMDALKMLLFESEDSELWDMNIVTTTPLPEEASAEGLIEWGDALLLALDRRSELRQQRLEIDAARLRHGRTLSERLAGVDLVLGVSSNTTDSSRETALEDVLLFEFPTYSATLSYNMPIGNKSADYAERAARAQVRSALVTYDQIELDVVSDVRNAVREVRYQAEAVRASQQSLVLARRQLENEQKKYEAQSSTTFQVLEFQQSLTEAVSNERMARVAFMKALVALRWAQGLLGEDE